MKGHKGIEEGGFRTCPYGMGNGVCERDNVGAGLKPQNRESGGAPLCSRS